MSEKSKIRLLYEDPKSKGFVNHLIQAYLPVYKPQKVWEFEDKKPHKCNVCSHQLIDLGTVIGRMQSAGDEFMHDSIEQMRKGIEGETIPREEHAIIKHITHGAIQAWQGQKTSTYLCLDCIRELLDLVTMELLHGDKNISYQVNKNRRSEVFTHFIENPNLGAKDKEEVKEMQKRVEKKHTATFGDLEVLQKLKEKMEKESKQTQS
jgi:hypothetical protein